MYTCISSQQSECVAAHPCIPVRQSQLYAPVGVPSPALLISTVSAPDADSAARKAWPEKSDHPPVILQGAEGAVAGKGGAAEAKSGTKSIILVNAVRFDSVVKIYTIK